MFGFWKVVTLALVVVSIFLGSVFYRTWKETLNLHRKKPEEVDSRAMGGEVGRVLNANEEEGNYLFW
jgi:hypothetical protein